MMRKIVKYVLGDIIRNKMVLVYTILLFVISLSVFNIETNTSKGILSLLNIILLIVPLTCIIFSTIYIYNSSEFIELLVSQPIKRKTIWYSLYFGLVLSLSLAYIIGIGLPALYYFPNAKGAMILIVGLFLTWVFVSIALLIAGSSRDKTKGIAIAIVSWLFFAIFYDILVLFILFQFQDYPLEGAMIVLSFLNPIDLSRIQLLLQIDAAAIIGYTGAVFKIFFGRGLGILICILCMCAWFLVPLWLSVKIFQKRDI